MGLYQRVFEPDDRVITLKGSFLLKIRKFDVQVAEDEWERDWEDYEVEMKAGLKGTVEQSSSYETTVKFDGGKEHRVLTWGLEKFNALDRIVDALNSPDDVSDCGPH